MTPSNIHSGFEVTWISPFNRNRISHDAFLPSSATDRPDPTNASGELPTSITDQSSFESTTTSFQSAVELFTGARRLSATSDEQHLSEFQALSPVQGPLKHSTLNASSIVIQSPMPTQLAQKAPVSEPIDGDPQPSISCMSPGALYEIRPLPKAGPRCGNRKIRRRARTWILTDIPEKLIEKEYAERTSTKKLKLSDHERGRSKQKQRSNSKQDKTKLIKEKREKIKKRMMGHSDSEEETFSLVCTEPYSNSKSRKHCIQCTSCKMWAHAECTEGSLNCVSELWFLWRYIS